ncbi:hypothetical protein F0267_01605 [Vibrio coralliilyticus]|uniref:Uncharacterized protein n=1 Tax=Vibrio coralliilyticus TaxID=190893 RepID=A0AAN0SJN1_9VIBR|nr:MULTISPECIES: hypothetical protein [Vibrio]AIW22365.1 hypothetical protein IX92_25170 [Vibrio coralliilyticus]MCZ2799020.1 hypothetical protein [Vibrio alginolyticus]NOH36919.1 hypothetical protein [Vibrio coralliilyticus]
MATTYEKMFLDVASNLNTSDNDTKIRQIVMSPDSEDLRLAMGQLIAEMAEYFIEGRNNMNPGCIAHQCHIVSHGFKLFFDQNCSEPSLPQFANLKLTVGNVFYKGENIYKATKRTVRDTIDDGRKLDRKLDVHVWLTASDMTVYDLSIIPTLRAKGHNIGSDASQLIVWRQEDKSDFIYKPLLVDDDFANKVDIISM